MKIIDIPGGQGSDAWHQHRRDHFNASDAPAMMGVSPYKTRSQLLHELATGIVPDVTPETQRLFDDGHRCEALARPVAEKIIGDDLYPIVVANGRQSASLDGATLEGKILFEHKRLNAELRAAMVDGCTGADLPAVYRVQMEQQLHCAADAERVLFMASSWSENGTLLEERHCWYSPDLELRAKILRGWEQFAEDLSNYKPAEAAPIVTAAPQEHLPAVSVQLTGSLAVVSNLQPFGVALRAFVDKIPKKPSTDQEFADTEAACKRLKEAEDRLQQAEDAALAGMSDVELMRRTVAELRELARTTRLASEKAVKQRKEQIREEEVARGHKALSDHLAALNRRLGGACINGMQTGNFGAVIKGLKSLDSVRNAIDTELARAKIEASELADKIDANLKTITASGAPHLFADKATLALKAPDDLAAIIAQRVQAEQQRIDAERERIRREEEARAQAEAARKAAAELEAARALQAQQAAQAAQVTPQQGANRDASAGQSHVAEGSASPAGRGADGPTACGAAPVSLPGGIVIHGPLSGSTTIIPQGCAVASVVLVETDEKPTLKLGDLNDWLKLLSVSAAQLEALGFQAHAERNAKLYKPSDKARIKAALIEWLERLA